MFDFSSRFFLIANIIIFMHLNYIIILMERELTDNDVNLDLVENPMSFRSFT